MREENGITAAQPQQYPLNYIHIYSHTLAEHFTRGYDEDDTRDAILLSHALVHACIACVVAMRGVKRVKGDALSICAVWRDTT